MDMDAQAGVITAEDIYRAIRLLDEQSQERLERVSARLEAFWTHIPQGARSDPAVLTVATLIQNDLVIHPKDAEVLNTAIDEAVARHGGSPSDASERPGATESTLL